MKKIIYIFIFSILLLGGAAGLLHSQDYQYQVTGMYESNDQGSILRQNPYSGWLMLYGNGTYQLKLHIDDQGTYQYIKANQSQPNDTIYFNSSKNFRFFAYPRQNTLEVWLYKTNTGTNQWVHAELSTAPTANPPAAAGTQGTTLSPANTPVNPGSLIKNGVFAQKVIYGNSSIQTYYLYDRATGSISADEKGILFRPDGTYFLRSEFGASVIEQSGSYRIVGDKVQIVFRDNSNMVLTLVNGGKSLNWYNQGMLISEYLFLGVVE